jgi:hypothetical protein
VTAYGSLVPEVKDAIVSVVSTATGIEMSRATPIDNIGFVSSQQGEAIWLGREGGQDVEIAAGTAVMVGGPYVPDEAFTVWFTIGVLFDTSDGTEQRAQLRAYEILGVALRAVMADPTLGLVLNGDRKFYGVTGHQVNESGVHLESGGNGCGLEVGIQAAGRLLI